MADLPIEEKIDLKDAMDRLIRNKQDAIDVMIYVTFKWKVRAPELAIQIERLKLKSRDKIVVVGKMN